MMANAYVCTYCAVRKCVFIVQSMGAQTRLGEPPINCIPYAASSDSMKGAEWRKGLVTLDVEVVD